MIFLYVTRYGGRRWVEHDEDERGCHLLALLDHVRLDRISTACFKYALASPAVLGNLDVITKLSVGYRSPHFPAAPLYATKSVAPVKFFLTYTRGRRTVKNDHAGHNRNAPTTGIVFIVRPVDGRYASKTQEGYVPADRLLCFGSKRQRTT